MADVVCVSFSSEQTRAIAGALGAALRGGDVVVLSGDLGAGKTKFVQGAADALGVRAHVTSPSFVLVREYVGVARIVQFWQHFSSISLQTRYSGEPGQPTRERCQKRGVMRRRGSSG